MGPCFTSLRGHDAHDLFGTMPPVLATVRVADRRWTWVWKRAQRKSDHGCRVLKPVGDRMSVEAKRQEAGEENEGMGNRE